MDNSPLKSWNYQVNIIILIGFCFCVTFVDIIYTNDTYNNTYNYDIHMTISLETESWCKSFARMTETLE